MPKRIFHHEEALSSEEALKLASSYLESAQNTNDPDRILELCADVEAALSRVERAERMALTNSSNARGTNPV
jgi:hypothetical protein